MKKIINTYTFTPGAADVGTIAFNEYTAINKSGILLIVNSTTGDTLYNFADPALLGTVATNVLTLATSTTGQCSGDNLSIFYEDGLAPSDLVITSAAAQTTAANNALNATAGTTATDALGYRSASVQVVSTGTGGTYIFEGSNNNTNWQTIPVWNQIILTGTPITAAITATSSQLIYTFPITTRYVRLRIATTITGGSIAAVTKLSTAPHTAPITQVAQATAANLNATVSGTVTANQGSANAAAWLANPLTPAVGTTGDTGAKTATLNGATQTNATSKGAAIVFNVGAVTGTTPTLVAKLQGSANGGTTWFDIAGATTETLTATGVYGIEVYPGIAAVAGTTTTGTSAYVNSILPRTWRVVYTITGTTPSFTLTNVQVAYHI